MTEFWLYLSLAFLLLGLGAALWVRIKQPQGMKALTFLSAGVFFACVFALIPYCRLTLEADGVQIPGPVLLAVHYSLKFFTFGAVVTFLVDASAAMGPMYGAYLTLLFVLAPVLTFSFLLSFLRNLLASFRLLRGRNREMYIFSQLNSQSEILAKDIRKHHKDALLVFADTDDPEQRAVLKTFGAIGLKSDMCALAFGKGKRTKPLHLFVMGMDEQKNVSLALDFLDRHPHLERAHLYVFTSNTESELLLTHTDSTIPVRRINPIRSLIYRFLDEDGTMLFDHARPNEEGTKTIHAVVLGLGRYGTELTKALAWYGQMDGYRLEVDVFDKDSKADDRFCALCPELMAPERNGVFEDGEAQYTIRIHSGMETGTKSFMDAVSALNRTTFAFVCLGSDEENIKAAVDLRRLFARSNIHPDILSVVYDPEATEALQHVTDYRKTPYDIAFLGNNERMYAEKAILHSRLEQDALARHMRWGAEEASFWNFEYNYRSSVASAIHIQARYLCKLPGADKPISQQTPEEREALRKLEHLRWNAYIRSEGYVYGGSQDPSARNDMAKTHNYLTNYYELSEKIKSYDECDGISDPAAVRRKED